jgi:hypothetical protein
MSLKRIVPPVIGAILGSYNRHVEWRGCGQSCMTNSPVADASMEGGASSMDGSVA